MGLLDHADKLLKKIAGKSASADVEPGVTNGGMLVINGTLPNKDELGVREPARDGSINWRLRERLLNIKPPEDDGTGSEQTSVED